MQSGKTLRNKGIAQVLESEDDLFKKDFDRVVKRLVIRSKERGIPFTSEDVRDRLKHLPTRSNSLPAKMQHAVRGYDLQPVGFCLASRASARRHRLIQWAVAA
jgi:hypothetical protein